MNRSELLDLHRALCDGARDLMTRKNHDYAGSQPEGKAEDPFANFRVAETLRLVTAEQGVLVRLSDKISRLVTFCQAGELKVKGESVIDTLLDVINYAVLFGGIVAEKTGMLFPVPDPKAVYLAGPINGQEIDYEWRNATADKLTAIGFTSRDPLREKNKAAVAADPFYAGHPENLAFVDRDLADISACGILLCHFPYVPDRQSVGTIWELGEAHHSGRRVLVCGPNEITKHPFIQHLAEGVFACPADAVAYLAKV